VVSKLAGAQQVSGSITAFETVYEKKGGPVVAPAILPAHTEKNPYLARCIDDNVLGRPRPSKVFADEVPGQGLAVTA
jgi:hypothetical protein